MPRPSQIKKQVRTWLQDPAAPNASHLISLPHRPVISALIAGLSSADEKAKFKAVKALGRVTASLALSDMEEAREVMRRLIWALNEESGAVGFGCPEAMGEIMAQHRGLASEFINMLISFINPQGNYLEFAPLTAGALWGVGRVARAWPELAAQRGAADYVPLHLDSSEDLVSSAARLAWEAFPGTVLD